MKAILVKDWGSPDDLVIEDVPSPPLKAGEVRVGVHAAGLNFGDVVMIAGQYQNHPERPFSPGFEAAGVVLEVGEGGMQFKVGDRVSVVCDYGAYAEEIVVPAQKVFPIPDEMDFITAASFFIAYSTSHVALTHRARLRAGETLLVHGAAGGVGLTAVEIGVLMGVSVIATASTQEKLGVAVKYGASYGINYTEGSFYKKVRELTGGRGADVIYDPVGGNAFDESVRCIAWEGRLIVIGFASGQIPSLPVNLALVKNFDLVGFFWGSYAQKNPQVIANSIKTLTQWYREGKLNPHISQVFPMEDVAKALNLFVKRQATGRVVLKIR